ncbi:MAG: Ig-like domain-containing protein [Dehalococcoidia bacterium]
MNKKRLAIVTAILVAVVALTILLDMTLINHGPAIASLEAPQRVLPKATCQIVCNARDRDGDGLSYNWSASEGSINGQGASVNWTAPDSEGSYNVTVVVTDGRGGMATRQLTITVRANKAPTIASLIADAVWVTPSSTVHVTCNASDPDGDMLTYQWAASGGLISGTGAVVTWKAPPAPGIYNITVVAEDGHRASHTKTVFLSVARQEPPTIQALRVDKERYGHCYLLEYSWGYKVGRGQKYDIECIALGTGELVYQWSCDGGEISGEGSLITWTAPDTSCYVTVMVIVSDAAGNPMAKNIVLQVVPCSHCTFGC